MSTTYEIRKVRTPDGNRAWTVVQFVDGEAKGGDHHWLYERAANFALRAYESGRAMHGDSASKVQSTSGIAR